VDRQVVAVKWADGKDFGLAVAVPVEGECVAVLMGVEALDLPRSGHVGRDGEKKQALRGRQEVSRPLFPAQAGKIKAVVLVQAGGDRPRRPGLARIGAHLGEQDRPGAAPIFLVRLSAAQGGGEEKVLSSLAKSRDAMGER